MTGPEHYQRAEELLKTIEAVDSRVPVVGSGRRAASLLAQAQVHATLALAAATAMSRNGIPAADFRAWDDTCGVAE